jgi:prefoldin beta subunit
MADIPPKLQNQIAQYQQIQQQLQMVMAQRNQYSLQLEEVERALDELGKSKPETPIYRNVGSLLIKVEKMDDLKKELDEMKDTLGIKVKSMERQENQLKERFNALRTELQTALKGSG